MITKKERAPGITVVTLANAAATAEISLYGGHILSYRPAGKDDILFMSDKAVFETGKPIRGGIPVCWPWFGPHAADKTLPAHGFVRTMNWKIVGEEDGESHSGLTLECTATAETKALWPHEFKVTIAFFVGKTLSIALTTENTGDEPFDFTDALHTYFRVGDIAKTTVVGFDGSEYVDRTVQDRRHYDSERNRQRIPQTGGLRYRRQVHRPRNHDKPAALPGRRRMEPLGRSREGDRGSRRRRV
jgi:glucose-6-phosphate 1-epimerase